MHIKPLVNSYTALSAGGNTQYKESVTFSRIRFPEFDESIWVEDVEFIVFEDQGQSVYDLVLGRDIIQSLGFNLGFKDQVVNWCNKAIPFVKRNNKPKPQSPTSIDIYLLESDYDTATTGLQ